ncbi:MAG TPA: hypothetical protein VGI05_01930 [Streptosporangiaceae bacterium]
MQTKVKALITAGTVVAVALGTAVAADAAIVTSQASLVNGQLTIVGSGAVPGSNVSVDDGPTMGAADAQGNFTISASGFSEPSCITLTSSNPKADVYSRPSWFPRARGRRASRSARCRSSARPASR